MTEKITFHLSAFDGPLDLLLHLIAKNKVNIYDIPISLILEQYMEILREAQEADMEVAGDFIAMAAQLMLIKSRMLLPKEKNEEDEEEGTITIYGDPKSYAAIQKHLEECGFEDVGGDFTYIPNDLKDVTPEQRETIDKMVERLEEFDDVQTVYTNMKPEEDAE